MRYVTQERVAELPGLDGLDTPDIEQALNHAGRVYAYIHRNEWITDDDLRAYGERNGIGPDEMSRALSILRDTGQIHVLDDSVTVPEETA